MRPTVGWSILSCLLVACVGDAPTNPDAGGEPDASGQDAGGGNDATTDVQQQTDALVDAGPSITGDFENVLLLNDTTTFQDIVTDANGDVVMVGTLQGSVQIGSYQYTAAGGRDVIVMRVAANNGIKWVKLLGGTYTEDGLSVALDATGDVYVVGDYNAGGPSGVNTPFAGKSITSPHSGYNSFVAKLDGATGSAVWAMSFDSASTTSIICHQVVARASTVVVGCSPRGQIAYTDTNNAAQTRTAGLDDPWIAELDPANGHVAWGVLMTGGSQDGLTTLALDGQNHLYVGGNIQSSTLTGDTPSFTITRKGTNPSSNDAFVLRFDPGAPRTLAWQQVYGAGMVGTNTDQIAIAADDSVYLEGSFAGTRDFGDGQQVTAAGNGDLYLLHLAAADGKTLAKTTMGGNNMYVSGRGLALDDVGNPIVAAYYSGPGFTLGGTNLPAATNQNLSSFVAKTSPDLATLHYVLATAAVQNDAGTGNGVRHNDIATVSTTGQSVTAGTLLSTADLGDGQQVTRGGGAYIIRRKR